MKNAGAIKWERSEDGFVRSKCGRFRIIPEYYGRVRAFVFRVEDSQPGGGGIAYAQTQRGCKDWAERVVNPPVYDGPEITEDML